MTPQLPSPYMAMPPPAHPVAEYHFILKAVSTKHSVAARCMLVLHPRQRAKCIVLLTRERPNEFRTT